jgi:5-methylcytosine-specific restriction endonuclease McrA
MSHIPAAMRRFVIRRAANRCEYCLLSQIGQEATFHIDHILPESKGGKTDSNNLALACVSCSLRKEARQSERDPETKKRIAIFHPRKDDWKTHFEWIENKVIGLTPKGRATIVLLRLNRPTILAIRDEESLRGRHPPP